MTTHNAFKVGDRVETTTQIGSRAAGDRGTIVFVQETYSAWPYRVDFDNGNISEDDADEFGKGDIHSADELTLVKEFAEGARIRVTDGEGADASNGAFVATGDEGEIEESYGHGEHYVRMDDGIGWFVEEEFMEVISAPKAEEPVKELPTLEEGRIVKILEDHPNGLIKAGATGWIVEPGPAAAFSARMAGAVWVHVPGVISDLTGKPVVDGHGYMFYKHTVEATDEMVGDDVITRPGPVQEAQVLTNLRGDDTPEDEDDVTNDDFGDLLKHLFGEGRAQDVTVKGDGSVEPTRPEHQTPIVEKAADPLAEWEAEILADAKEAVAATDAEDVAAKEIKRSTRLVGLMYKGYQEAGFEPHQAFELVYMHTKAATEK